mgnify:CR=1 FL=1|jgi:transposase
MGAAVKITRLDMTTVQLRFAARQEKDSTASRRILAIALILEGSNRTRAAESCGMDRQTLRDWVHRYNAEGLAGLCNRIGGGRKSRLNKEQKAKFESWVEAGPDPDVDGVVRWRCADLVQKIKNEFDVHYHERTVGKHLSALGFRRLSVRPQHPKSDPDAQNTFKKTSLIP